MESDNPTTSEVINSLLFYQNISIRQEELDGNWCVILTHLRYTLLDFERNSQIKIPSNQIKQKRLYSTKKTYHGNNISVNNLSVNNLRLIKIQSFKKITKNQVYIGEQIF